MHKIASILCVLPAQHRLLLEDRSPTDTTPLRAVALHSTLKSLEVTGEHAWDGRRHCSRLSGWQPGPAKSCPQLSQGAGQVGVGAGDNNLRRRRLQGDHVFPLGTCKGVRLRAQVSILVSFPLVSCLFFLLSGSVYGWVIHATMVGSHVIIAMTHCRMAKGND